MLIWFARNQCHEGSSVDARLITLKAISSSEDLVKVNKGSPSFSIIPRIFKVSTDMTF